MTGEQHQDAIEPQPAPNPAPDVEKLTLRPIRSHISNHDMALHDPHHTHDDEEIYNRFPHHRKVIMTCVLSLCSFLAPISSTSILSAIPEVAATYHSSGSVINLSNAMYMLFMGISPCFWGPLSKVYGRRWVCLISAVLFFAFSIGTALAPNLVSFFVFRILTAFQGTAFLIVGAACLGDIYAPTTRATAMGWFLSGTLIGPAFGPFIGGIIVTYQSWRVIFWLQTALSGLATICVIFLLPESIPTKLSPQLHGLPLRAKSKLLWSWTSPFRVITLLTRYPNLLAVAVASSSLVWNMYSLLTPIRYVLNPRFHLTSPIQSGLFYIAPGCGYLAGTFVGGRYADYVVKKYMSLSGTRIPEDRLRSCLPFLGIVIPACMLVYGWSVEKAVGGIPVPVLAMFIQGVAQLFCFPSLNTYCLDVMQGRSSEVISGNYMVRYFFAALGSAVVLPAIEKVGVGWFSTISSVFMVAGSGLVWAVIKWGNGWQNDVDRKIEEKERVRKEKRMARANELEARKDEEVTVETKT